MFADEIQHRAIKHFGLLPEGGVAALGDDDGLAVGKARGEEA
jgi:hypothetical protein